MAHHEQQQGTAADPAAPAAIAPLSAQGAARRRLAGLGASGVLMTVASKHAMAELVCKSPSGALSGNLNSQRPNVACSGAVPHYWRKAPESWPSDIATGDPFSKYFSTSGPLAGISCLNILKHHPDDKHEVAMHIMATYLNVATGRISFLTRQAVVDIWAEWDRDGSYIPAAGALPWDGAALVAYLSSTMS